MAWVEPEDMVASPRIMTAAEREAVMKQHLIDNGIICMSRADYQKMIRHSRNSGMVAGWAIGLICTVLTLLAVLRWHGL